MVEAAGQAAAKLEPAAEAGSGDTAKDPGEADTTGASFSLLDARGDLTATKSSRPGSYKGKFGGRGVGGGISAGGDGSDGGGGGSDGKRCEGWSPVGLAALLEGFRLVASSPYLRLIAFFLVSQGAVFLDKMTCHQKHGVRSLAMQLSIAQAPRTLRCGQDTRVSMHKKDS